MGGSKAPKPTGTTTTTTQQSTAPWSVQQPYLEQGFQGAQNLYQNWVPQYYPDSTVAPFTDLQNAGLGTIGQTASELLGAPKWGALNSLDYLMSGQQFGNDPAVAPLTAMSGTNTGLSNPGSGVLSSLIGGNSAYANPAFGSLANMATGGLSGIGNLASSSIAPSQATMFSGLAPSMSTLGSFASGSQTDPFLSNVAQSTLANVVPSIESQFINGGGLSSPQAAYATSQGATAALAPVISNALLQEQQNQLGAAGALGNLGIAGGQALQNLSLNPANALSNLAGLQAGIGQGLGSQIMQGQGLQQQGAGALGNLALGGAGLQTQQLGDIGNLFNTATQQQLQATGLFPSTAQGALGIGESMFNAGAQQQQQNQAQLQDAINRWNYSWQLPYNMLNTYQSQVGGNYGSTGTGSTSSPYYINQGANALSGALGGGILGNSIGNLFGGSAGGDWNSAQGLDAVAGWPSESGIFGDLTGGQIGGGIGAGIGAILPFLGSFFSDRRLKTDIRRIGTAANGLPLYLFRFHGDPSTRVGVMADEVEKVRPEAVAEGPFGLKLVDYNKALG